jgi:hypothetical protein
VVDRDGGADLVADAVLMAPAALDAAVGPLREALATLKAQAELGVPLASSVGWSEDVGEREVPGDADLLEISIVGIPSDPRTTTASADEATLARAVDAAAEGFDVGTFVRTLRGEYEVGDETVTIDPPQAMRDTAAMALAKDDELEPGCGTGAGRQSAQAIVDDDVGPERIDDIAAYLTSHEEDVTADGAPSEWSDEEWADCGNLQYALWGGDGSGDALAWAQERANAVAEAAGEDRPYPDRAARNLDDPEFDEGDAVEWSSNDATVRGRVADVGDEFSPAEGVTITGDEGEAVYLIHELDDSLEPPQYRRENVAKPESSLDESQVDLPPLEGNFADDEASMTDDDTAGDDPGDDERDEPTLRGMEEQMAEMREMMEENTRMTREMREEMMGGDGEDEDEDGDEDGEENAADADDEDERTLTVDGEEVTAADIRTLREEAADTDPADPETTDRADTDDTDDDGDAGFGFASMED